MFAVRRLSAVLALLSVLFLLAACQDGTSSSSPVKSRAIAKNFQWLPMFGDGVNDASDVIATVGEVEITSRDLELYLDELPDAQRAKYSGPDGERLLVKRMVDYALLVQGSVAKKLYNDPDVARTIISQRRNALQSGMVNYGLLRDRRPTDEEITEYFMNHRGQYRQLGVVQARHIETLTKADADEAYRRLSLGGKGNDWMSVMVDFSVNEETMELEGSLGWFNQGGVIPFIRDSQKLTNRIYPLEIGIHPPFLNADRWQVVEILKRDNQRPMTFAEAKGQVEIDMLPAWQDGLVRDYLLDAREQYPVEMRGRFAPGQGLSVDELLTRANAVADGEQKIELLNLIYTDYPQSGRADDALFLAALTALETWSDPKVAERYLMMLLDEYPDSELIEDAKFLKENLFNPDVLNPKSIEELRK